MEQDRQGGRPDIWGARQTYGTKNPETKSENNHWKDMNGFFAFLFAEFHKSWEKGSNWISSVQREIPAWETLGWKDTCQGGNALAS